MSTPYKPARSLAGAALATGLLLGAAVPALAATTLSVSSWQFEEPGNAEWWAAVIDAYEEKYPDVSVEKIYVPFGDYLTQLTVRFASNRPPAVLGMSEQMFGAYAAQGWLAGLDDRIEGTDIATEWAGPQEELTWDDETRGVLLSNSVMMLFYNQKILDEAGVEVPTSWEEFKSAVAETTDRDEGVFGLAAVTTEHPTAVEELHRYTQWAGTELVKDGQYNLTSDEVVAALEEYRNTVAENAPLGNNSSIARQLFVDGRTAFLIDGPWVWSRLEQASEEMRPNLKMVAVPFERQLAPGGVTLHVAAGLEPEIEDAAWNFVDLATQLEWNRQYTILTGQPSGRGSSTLTEEQVAEAPHLGTIEQASTTGVPLFPTLEPIRANFAEYQAILMEAALRILSTDEAVADIMADTQSALERAIPLG